MGSAGSPGNCKQCEKGTYASKDGMTKCVVCPEGKTTLFKGSVGMGECGAGCPAGEYGWIPVKHDSDGDHVSPKVDYVERRLGPGDGGGGGGRGRGRGPPPKLPQHKCTQCPKGTYSLANQAALIQDCKTCPDGYSTESSGATSEDACSICAVDWFEDSKGNCQPCGDNEQASASHKACVQITCDAGYHVVSSGKAKSCSKCPPGKYAPAAGSSTSCEVCFLGFYNADEAQKNVLRVKMEKQRQDMDQPL